MYLVITLLVIITLTFFLMKLAPGSPFGTEEIFMTEAVQHQLNVAYGLNNPWYVQFKDYLLKVLQFDFGTSMKYAERTTNDIIRETFPVSFQLGMQSLLIALGTGTALGILSAAKAGQLSGELFVLLALVMISFPSFILAGFLQYWFGLKLGWLPISGWKSFSASVLPTIALGLADAGNISRLLRSSALVEYHRAYVDLARAKGLSQRRIMFVHVLRNAFLPVLSYAGPLVATVLTGSFVVENLFAIPGLGSHLINSIHHRDYPVIMGTTIFYALLMLVSVFITDLIAVRLYPWMKQGGQD